MVQRFAASVAAVLLAGSVAGSAPTQLLPIGGSAATVQWAGSYGVTFRYPVGWYRTAECFPHWCLMAAVSNQPVHDPCTTRGTGTTCRDVVVRLQDGALLVEWWAIYYPFDDWSIAAYPGNSTRIDGIPGRLQEVSGSRSSCPAGADVSISVVLTNRTEFSACMRGPGLDLEASTAMAILHSARFASP